MEVIASYRAKAYIDFLPNHNYDITLLTHRWEEDNGSWRLHNTGEKELVEPIDQNARIVRIPRLKHRANHWRHWLYKVSILRKIYIAGCLFVGDLDADPILRDSYRSFKKFLFDSSKIAGYDLVISIFSPHYHHRLAYKIHKRFSIPFVLDFRDLWNNRVVHINYKPRLVEFIQDLCCKYYWKKWLNASAFFTITSAHWLSQLTKLTRTEGYVVYNGYEAELFKEGRSNADEQFVILHAGNLYSHQHLEIFLEGCKQFIKNTNPENFKVKFVGGDRSHSDNQLSGYLPNAKKKILSYLDEEYCEVTKRIPKKQLMTEYDNVQVLLLPSFPDSPGTPPAKVFDYLALHKHIMVVPDDNDFLSEIIKETRSGSFTNTPEDVESKIEFLYNLWLEGHEIPFEGDKKKIAKFSRENQVEQLAKVIDRYFG